MVLFFTNLNINPICQFVLMVNLTIYIRMNIWMMLFEAMLLCNR